MEVIAAAWSVPPAPARLSPWQLTLATTASRRSGSDGCGGRLGCMTCSSQSYADVAGLDAGDRPELADEAARSPALVGQPAPARPSSPGERNGEGWRARLDSAGLHRDAP